MFASHRTAANKTLRAISTLCVCVTLKVVKRIWDYIKEHNLQNPKDRRKIIPDEVLGTFLKAPVNMMSMNAQLTKHVFARGDLSGDLAFWA